MIIIVMKMIIMMKIVMQIIMRPTLKAIVSLINWNTDFNALNTRLVGLVMVSRI